MRKGLGLIELMISFSIFAVLTTYLMSLFVFSQRTCSGSSAKIDSMNEVQKVTARLYMEIQESSPQGIRINSAHDAILLISARDASNNFTFYAGTDQLYSGRPNWQKWIAYYLVPQTGSAYSSFLRKEGNPFGSALPADPPQIPDPGSNWESVFRSSTLPAILAASNVEIFRVQDINCGTTGSPLYLQIQAARDSGGRNTSYNPGVPVIFGCSGTTGNWVQIAPEN